MRVKSILELFDKGPCYSGISYAKIKCSLIDFKETVSLERSCILWRECVFLSLHKGRGCFSKLSEATLILWRRICVLRVNMESFSIKSGAGLPIAAFSNMNLYYL